VLFVQLFEFIKKKHSQFQFKNYFRSQNCPVPAIKLFQIPELPGSSFLIISGQRTVGFVSLQKKSETVGLGSFQKTSKNWRVS
jgi:hypothetical protein